MEPIQDSARTTPEGAMISPPVLMVSEIFYSLQGEGGRAGSPSIFIRLQGCTAKHACYASGILCDTEFESGRPMEFHQILAWIRDHGEPCRWIVWTGGEPLDQLTPEWTRAFRAAGFQQAIETSGLHPLPEGMIHVIRKNWFEGPRVQELRYVRHRGQEIPRPAIMADHLFLSPHSDGLSINPENLRHCIDLCLRHPEWKLSVQQHKLWRVL
jgi:7-carboxy-7-deazaguanine synthase